MVQVSVYGSCNRPFLWKWFYETLSMNKVNFEVVFVGNVKPEFELPSNFRFIYSEVKPSQCAQIGAANCKGEILQRVADDCQYSPYALDEMYKKYKELNDYKCMIAPHFYSPSPEFGGEDITDWACRLVGGDTTSLPVGLGHAVSNQLFRELGGFDKRFVFSRFDVDFDTRAQLSGGRIEFQHGVWIAERKDLTPNWQSGLYYEYTPGDIETLNDLWFKDGQFTGKRKDNVQSFEQNETFMTVSQGPKGRW